MNEKIKIYVFGAGAWGTTIANLLSEKGYDVFIWAREKEVVDSINKKNVNRTYLGNVKLSKKLLAFNEIKEFCYCDILINAIPTQYIKETLNKIKELKKETLIVSLSKGIETNTFKRPSEILYELFKRDIYVLSGPNFAIEVAQKKPTATTIAGKDKEKREFLQKIFSTPYFRVYENDDVVGVEISGAVKNVIAIAAGMCDALKLGNNAKAALITRGLNEIRKLGKKLGANDITFLGLSGIGDLILTCNSNISRNYSTGYLLGKGKDINFITNKTKHIAEGIKTSLALKKLSEKLGVEMPISEQVYKVIYENQSPKKAVELLMSRTLKPEFYG
jgi:glycerol-3-phosphate dehydrogenase (NAD(P)+)